MACGVDSDKKKGIIDAAKLQKLADNLGCSLDDLFEWTDIGPIEFIRQIGDTAGFDVDAFLKTDVEKLDFEKIMTGKGLLKKLSTLPKNSRTIDQAINLSLF